MKKHYVTIDGNEAAAYSAYHTNEIIAIYPITPSSPMGELSDAWSAAGVPNIWGTVPRVIEMQSEGGASGAVHGALSTGALSTTFTSSQGLLLMIPNMFKIAGELTPMVIHIAARTLATHCLSIFGDHSDVMACRSTGYAFLASNSIQEVMDFALIAQAATLKSRVPFLHFFDGFRISHEVQKVEQVSLDVMRAMIDDELVRQHRARALNPDRPVIRGTAQNPDHFFQGRESINKYYFACAGIVQEYMNRYAGLVDRHYHLFDYTGSPDAERVIIMMGSGAEAAHEAVDFMNNKGENVGLVKVRLYRPFSIEHFIKSLPPTVKSVAVLDRTKEPGAIGEPLYVDVVNAFVEAQKEGIGSFKKIPNIIGGRYGLSSKEFTPAMVKGVFDELNKEKPKKSFSVGINDDVTYLSISYDPDYSTEGEDVFRGVFFGLGADGTVGANKNSIKIIGEETENYAQGYFVYDSRKAGTVTVSHLRFGKQPIRSIYLVNKAKFVACHQWVFLEKYDMLDYAIEGAIFLLNSPYGPDEIWDKIPREVQEQIIKKKIRFFVIDAYEVAKKTGMGARVNTIMQTCFFAISNVLPKDEAIQAIKDAIKKTYGGRGDKIVQMNYAAVEQTVANLFEVKYPNKVTSTIKKPPIVSEEAPEFVKGFTAEIIAGRGDLLPVSKFPVDGTFPTATTQWEKRNIALEIPVWDPSICIQCGKCAIVCPHAAIRTKVYEPKYLEGAPATFLSMDYKGNEFSGWKYSVQVAPEDCTGCVLCVEACPAKSKEEAKHKSLNMQPQIPLREQERENYAFFLAIPDVDRRLVRINTVKGSQLLRPLFEYSGACSGCGETPYVKLLSQLFGDRAVIGNATGCSSIYGGNLPTTPYCQDANGRGPAWCNSLFEDNAEFGFGFRLTFDKHMEYGKELVKKLAHILGDELAKGIVKADQTTEEEIYAQRERVAELQKKLADNTSKDALNLLAVADALVKRSVWILGGDGWAYDIGYGGLDHVLASGRDVNVLVLDTEVYSNTGGQMSKATPRAAVAKFAASGKPAPKKDLGLMAMAYSNVYVAQVALGSNDAQCLRAFLEAEAYPGPSLIIAYSHCIAHGINMIRGLDQQKKAVDSGYWILYRYNPALIEKGECPLKIDSKDPKFPFEEYAYYETRYQMLTKSDPEGAKLLMKAATNDVKMRWNFYQQFSKIRYGNDCSKKDK
ncbi:MAG: pyruvate:ferredoxin (flavodoxin) oxidoreductase [Candidatus Fischerbacteria bacterium RBG_13_37_8]|uniref:Pyruvate:ferredoxin (Flavodoxin) oxidoreductase n=1 Tax=Candidatus Fischerbacteria bacterium RBG_13_37_8 TaxID=1817863 RepID=A0A1F5V7H9_9BACT|nr:MAG: pyruvate:ferredoxin (flavodoxin) oxidoreductase [Candidatus Fischerbacteria bacterium RBG_13_37_8]